VATNSVLMAPLCHVDIDRLLCSELSLILSSLLLYACSVFFNINNNNNNTNSGTLSTRELHSLCTTDGKRPDGVTLVPWKRGRCLDATCPGMLLVQTPTRSLQSTKVVNKPAQRFFGDAAFSAAALAANDVAGRCDAAKVSGTVTSQVRHLPRDHDEFQGRTDE